MQPDARFLLQPREFWANVRLISQNVGYTVRGTGEIKVPTLAEIRRAFATLGLDPSPVVGKADEPTRLGTTLIQYYEHRAHALNDQVRLLLMDKDEARMAFEALREKLRPTIPMPMNKQNVDKRAPAYLTAMVNMLVDRHADGLPCDYDPKSLTSVVQDGMPLRTLARRVDGAFTSVVNPVAVWEVKEYYYTTTFGSRVADGVYETLLDGFELEELPSAAGIHVGHYLMVDGRFTWWDCGRSYLCRIIDMLHMGLLDEAIFGREALGRLPELVPMWVDVARRRQAGETVDLLTHATLRARP